MSRVQRIYLYTAALISLVVLLLSLINAATGLIELGLSDEGGLSGAALAQSGVLPWLGLAALAAIVWGTHWFLANREARTLTMAGSVERAAPERKAYLYLSQFAALSVLAVEAGLALYAGFLVALGQPRGSFGAWPARPVAAGVGAALALGVWSYQRWITASDGDFGREPRAGVWWRRAYYYLGTALATLLAAFGAGEFLRTFLTVGARIYVFSSSAAETGNWRALVAASLAVTVVALPLAAILWLRANRAVAAGDLFVEVNALSRKLLVHAGMMAGAAITLITFAYLIWQTVTVVLGQPIPSAQSFWEQTVVPALAYLPIGMIVWLAFGGAASGDIEWADENEDAAVLRRIYYYLMTAISIGAFWYGLQALLVLAILLAVGVWPPAILAGEQARKYFSLAAALLVVGGPAWWGHWRSVQNLARLEGPAGYAERTSVLRKVYLYGVVLAAGVVAAITLIVVIARAPGWLFGPTAASTFAESLVELGVGIAIALLWWITHGFVLRNDERMRAEDERMLLPEPVQERVAVPREPLPGDRAERTVRVAAPSPERRPVEPPASSHAAAGPERRAEVGPANGQSAPGDTGASVPPAPAVPLVESAPPQETAEPVMLRSRRFTIVAVIDGGDGALGGALLAALRQAFPNLVLWPVGLTPAAQDAMTAALGDQVSGARGPALQGQDAVARASIILGPSDILAPGGLDGEVTPELAAAVAASTARKVLLPPRHPAVRWVGAPEWPLERWVENAVTEVGDAVAAGQLE